MIMQVNFEQGIVFRGPRVFKSYPLVVVWLGLIFVASHCCPYFLKSLDFKIV
jgi:hypothetical protein